MASTNSVVFVNTAAGSKSVTLPAASTVPGRILYIKDIEGNSAYSSTVTISCPSGDTIDKRPYTSTVLVSTGAGVVKLASDGQTNWMILSYYNLALGIPDTPPVPPPPPPGPTWFTVLDGDGSVVDNGGGSFTCNGPNDSGGAGWSYIYAFFTDAGSFTYNFNWFTSDGIFFDWPFEYVTAADPAFPFNVNFSNKIASSSSESGTRTVSYGANEYVVLGVYSSDSCCGNGVCTFSGLPV